MTPRKQYLPDTTSLMCIQIHKGCSMHKTCTNLVKSDKKSQHGEEEVGTKFHSNQEAIAIDRFLEEKNHFSSVCSFGYISTLQDWPRVGELFTYTKWTIWSLCVCVCVYVCCVCASVLLLSYLVFLFFWSLLCFWEKEWARLKLGELGQKQDLEGLGVGAKVWYIQIYFMS